MGTYLSGEVPPLAQAFYVSASHESSHLLQLLWRVEVMEAILLGKLLQFLVDNVEGECTTSRPRLP